MRDATGARRKIIIFTEHRDTLEYLADAAAHHARPLRRRRHHPRRHASARTAEATNLQPGRRVRLLVATDAAGEGLNLQRAHLMVNYDLPWNPNRIEQRFGRIHRIGQTEVCHLWNLVADDTREGDGLPPAAGEDRGAAQGLPSADGSSTSSARLFEGQPLKDLLIEAIRYGDRPRSAPGSRGHRQTVGEGLDKLIAERAVHSDICAIADLEEIAPRDGRGEPRRLQPHYISAFFREAFKQLGGRLPERESGRYEITPRPRRHPRPRPRRRAPPPPRAAQYERVTFDKNLVAPRAKPKADLLAPGHPLLGGHRPDHRTVPTPCSSRAPCSSTGRPRHRAPFVAVTHEITDGHDPARTITKKFGFAIASRRCAPPGGTVPWATNHWMMPNGPRGVSPAGRALARLGRGGRRPRLGRHRGHARGTRPHPRPGHRPRRQVRRLVKQRLTGEINYWDMRSPNSSKPVAGRSRR